MSQPVTAVDGKRLTVLTRSSSTDSSQNPPSPPVKTYLRPGASLDEITNKVTSMSQYYYYCQYHELVSEMPKNRQYVNI